MLSLGDEQYPLVWSSWEKTKREWSDVCWGEWRCKKGTTHLNTFKNDAPAPCKPMTSVSGVHTFPCRNASWVEAHYKFKRRLAHSELLRLESRTRKIGGKYCWADPSFSWSSQAMREPPKTFKSSGNVRWSIVSFSSSCALRVGRKFLFISKDC